MKGVRRRQVDFPFTPECEKGECFLWFSFGVVLKMIYGYFTLLILLLGGGGARTKGTANIEGVAFPIFKSSAFVSPWHLR